MELEAHFTQSVTIAVPLGWLVLPRVFGCVNEVVTCFMLLTNYVFPVISRQHIIYSQEAISDVVCD